MNVLPLTSSGERFVARVPVVQETPRAMASARKKAFKGVPFLQQS